ncbi:enoyl-CoA hydratase/isomerase family protein [Lacisediminimonas profundi]|uniref:enoyl-CoA hydratase/isomerase family protein n=1 Tax=Lacisediminimonas profundi TaxID=2603856 RepID=UPI0013873868|nr:enoyl-CoA hydratase/isomerase family protein [Lacisediminimonas profundi]
MIENIPAQERGPRMLEAGMAQAEVQAFLQALDFCDERLGGKTGSGTLKDDASALRQVCLQGRALIAQLPVKSARSRAQKRAVEAIQHPTWQACVCFFRLHVHGVYCALTDDGHKSLRVDALLSQVATLLPGILPSDAELEHELGFAQKDKDGLEIIQGLFVSAVLSQQDIGSHLVRSMLRPTAQALSLLDEFIATGRADLGVVKVEVLDGTATVTLHNERYLNSEDDTTVQPLEVAFDLVLLHPDVRLGVLRGSVVDHPKYKGRRIFCSGINLTRIYQGKQSYVSFLFRNMAMHPKIYRGILPGDFVDSIHAPLNEPENTLEKMWVAVVETFAIGGGCQLLLVVDYVIAESGSYFSLPARKEGFIPGVSNMRLPRYVGERLAKQAILFDKRFDADTPEGRLIANEVVAPDQMESALRNCVDAAVGSGLVSAGGNRKVMRIQSEPFDLFRQYLATYAREQAFCSLSEQLIANLERHWNAKERKL